MSWLKKKLDDWSSHNFITGEQAQKIISYEATKISTPWVFRGFLTLGVVVIGVGIIALFAAHWKDIPDALKLSVDFVLLIVLGMRVYMAWNRNQSILFEILLIGFMILCLASIGLISQIYHVGGKFYEAVFLWSIITSVAAAAARRSFIPFIWATGFFLGGAFTILDYYSLEHWVIAWTVPLLSACLTFICMYVDNKGGQTKAFKFWAVISSTIVVMLAVTASNQSIDLSIAELLSTYALAALLVWGIWRSFEYKKIQKILLQVVLIFYLVVFHFPLFSIRSEIAYDILSIIILSTMAIFLASLRCRRLFQFFLVLIGAIFLKIYFRELGGLATTGAGLIFSGSLMIFMVLIWDKYRLKITTWAEGVVK